MYKRKSVHRRFVTAGERRFKIEICSVTATASNDGKSQFAYTVLISPYAAIETPSPDDNFDGISTDTDSVTHIFHIGHIKTIDIDIKHVIRFNGNYYKILKAENAEEAILTDVVYCSHHGSVLKNASHW